MTTKYKLCPNVDSLLSKFIVDKLYFLDNESLTDKHRPPIAIANNKNNIEYSVFPSSHLKGGKAHPSNNINKPTDPVNAIPIRLYITNILN